MVELGYVDAVSSHVSDDAERLKKQTAAVESEVLMCIGKPSGQYVAKMEDVLEVYQRPATMRVIRSCVWMKSAKNCMIRHAAACR